MNFYRSEQENAIKISIIIFMSQTTYRSPIIPCKYKIYYEKIRLRVEKYNLKLCKRGIYCTLHRIDLKSLHLP